MSIFRDFFVKQKPIFTGITRGVGGFGFGAADTSGGGAGSVKATGGTKYTNGSQTVHEFLVGGDTELVVHQDIPAVTYLVVGGGGGGGGYTTRGGGGGAGGVRSNHPDAPAAIRTPSSYSLPAGTYPVTVGDGGLPRGDSSGSWPNSNNGPAGGNTVNTNFGTPGYSSFFNDAQVNSVSRIVATGGGAGIWGGAGAVPNATGGSGGGAGDWDSGAGGAAAVTSPDGLGPTVQGYAGGASPPVPGNYQSGGGGGAGGAASVSDGGRSGPSVQISIRGKNTTPVGEYYGGGGQGTGPYIPSGTVSDPGGSGGRFSTDARLPNSPVGDLPARASAGDGYPGTGGGGSGNTDPDGKGGSGIIIISYPT